MAQLSCRRSARGPRQRRGDYEAIRLIEAPTVPEGPRGRAKGSRNGGRLAEPTHCCPPARSVPLLGLSLRACASVTIRRCAWLPGSEDRTAHIVRFAKWEPCLSGPEPERRG